MLTKKLLSLAIFISLFLTSCEVIGGIFKAGVWVGVLIVVVIVLALVMIFRKRS